MKRFLIAGLTMALLTGATYVLGYSTLLTVSSIEVIGSDRPINIEIVKGQKLARVEPRAVAAQLKKLDWVESAEVSRNWISGKVVVEITSRTPIATFENQVIDSTASSFMPQGIPVKGLIQIQAANLADAKSGVKFLTQLPQELKSTLTVVKVSTTGVLVLITQNSGKEIEIRWGSNSDNELKLKVYKALIALPENADIKRVDVSAPTAPIVK
jgi:cell division protein FtsQ